MAIASMIVHAAMGATQRVAARLSELKNVSVCNLDPQRHIIITIEGDSLDDVSEMACSIQANDDVVGVFPVYINDEDILI